MLYGYLTTILKHILPETTSASFGPQVTKPQVIISFLFCKELCYKETYKIKLMKLQNF